MFVKIQIPGPHPHLLALESLGTRRWNLHFIHLAQRHVILTVLFSSLRHSWTMNWNEGPAWCRETSQRWGRCAKEAGGGLVPEDLHSRRPQIPRCLFRLHFLVPRFHSPQKAPVLICSSSHEQKADSNWANGALPRGRRRIKSEGHRHLRTCTQEGGEVVGRGGPHLTPAGQVSSPAPLSIPISQDSIPFPPHPPHPRLTPQPSDICRSGCDRLVYYQTKTADPRSGRDH